MKHFTQKEKNIICGIIEGAAFDTYVLTNAFNEVLNGKGVAFDSEKGFLQYDPSKYYNNISAILQVERDFIETALLIKYLVEHQYIYIIKDSQEPPLPWVGDTIINPIGKQIPADIAEIFVNSCARIVVLNRLLDLRNNKFCTYEELQLIWARRQTIFAACTLGVAILTLLATLFMPCCPHINNDVNEGDATKITAEIDVEVISSRLDRINNYLLQIIEQNNNLTNNFKISPKLQINTSKKSATKRQTPSLENKCSDIIPIYMIDTINCDGETYWVLPCPHTSNTPKIDSQKQ